jgi:signal transduction histidine kinase
MLVAAALPLALAGWSAIRLSEDSLEQRTMDAHATNAKLVAERIADGVRAQLRTVQLAAAALDFSNLDAEEKLWGMRLMFRQISWASAIVLLNEDGSQAAGPVYLGKVSSDPGLSDRPILNDADIEQFGAGLPFRSALEVGSALGTPYVAADGSTRLGLGVRTPQRQVLAVELHLNVLSRLMGDHLGDDSGLAFVVDSGGFVILAADASAATKRADRSGLPLVSKALAAKESTGYFEHPELGRSLGAGALVPDLGWAVVVAEPAERALASSKKLTQQTMLWFLGALAAAILLGLILSRAILKPIEALNKGAKTIMGGDLGYRVEGIDREDELGSLAKAFNSMATEIETWNEELENKVAEKTSELKESQELLARAQKLAAVGELGAGLAHAINNPLTGIISNVQLMLMDEEEGSENHTSLEAMQLEAKQIGELVGRLIRLADKGQGVHKGKLDLASCVRSAEELSRSQFAAAAIKTSMTITEGLPYVAGDAEEFLEALLELFTNARHAMKDGGKLDVQVSSRDDLLISIKIRDTGCGMSREESLRAFEPFYTSRVKSGAKGMGLARVHQIVENHNGQITIASEVGEGTTVSLLVPTIQSRSIQ